MRVLVAGDRGYIGTVMVPFLRAAGHTVEGLDLDLYEGCDMGPGPDETVRPMLDMREVRSSALRRVRRRDLPGRTVQRPGRATSIRRRPTPSISKGPSSSAGREAGRRRAFPVRFLVQPRTAQRDPRPSQRTPSCSP